MAEPKKEGKATANWVTWSVFLLAVAIAAGASFLYRESDRAQVALEDAKRDYEEMQRLKGMIAEGKLRSRRASPLKESTEDPLSFLGRKAIQAGIPQNVFRPSRSTGIKQGPWTETDFTVTMQGAKDAPVLRASVADFIVAVETERPSIKSKNLSLSFAPGSSDLGSVSITFAQFQRD
jgi:hypothetical protein